MEKEQVLESLGKDLDKLMIRFFIRGSFPNYDELQTYIIYDGNEIEIYDEQSLKNRKNLGQVKSYLISRPIRIR